MTNPDLNLQLSTALADLPAKVRVHDLAKRAGTGSKEIIAGLALAGVSVGSASSSVDRDVATALLVALLSGPDDVGDAAEGAAVPEGRPPAPAGPAESADGVEPGAAGDDGDADVADPGRSRRRRGRGGRSRNRGAVDRAAGDRAEDVAAEPAGSVETEPSPAPEVAVTASDTEPDADAPAEEEAGSASSRRRRRGRRGRGRPSDGDQPADTGPATASGRATEQSEGADDAASGAGTDVDAGESDGSADAEGASETSRRRRRRRRGSGTADPSIQDDDPDDTVVHVREPRQSANADVVGVRGSTRLEAKRQRRKDTRDSRRRPQILSEAEFLARRESVERVMAIRQRGDLSQVALLEDGVLVEHFVSRAGSESMIGNVYLGRVQNVLPSMEAAFVDIGRGRNAVLYAGEVNWDMAGLVGKARRIETALSSGDTVLVQVSKDPVGHKGSRLTSQISLPGRFLVYVPGGGATGISRKLPDTERRRLKSILDRIVPEGAGVIIRTAAEGVEEAELVRDVERLRDQWEQIEATAAKKSSAPVQLYGEPGTLIKVIRDLFNSDITSLVVDGDQAWAEVSEYVLSVAPELAPRVGRYAGEGDVFAHYRVDEQIAKALERKVHLPSGGSLVIDRTEAMTVVDVNTGKFTGSGGNLEETVTRNNLEAAEEVVRQLRLRDIGGIIVVDFIDMVLESNRELVLRRLTECLGRDRTRHQVAEVTSLGLVQMTRKRMGIGLVEAFSEPCPHCGGRGIVLHDAPIAGASTGGATDGEAGERRNRRRGRPAHEEPIKIEPLIVDRVVPDAKPDPRGPRPPAAFRAESGDAESDDAFDQAASQPETGGSGDDDRAPALPAEGGVEGWTIRETDGGTEPTGPDTNVVVAEVAIEIPPVVKPARRRRAAGRPAGAPTSVTEVLDLVIPVGGATRDGRETPTTDTPTSQSDVREAQTTNGPANPPAVIGGADRNGDSGPAPDASVDSVEAGSGQTGSAAAPARRRASRAAGSRASGAAVGSGAGGSGRSRKSRGAQVSSDPVAAPAD